VGIEQARIPGVGKHPFTLVVNQVIKPATLLMRLADFGYEKVGRLVKPGEFRALGDVIDIFPLLADTPVRLEFWGNQIEAISPLDINEVQNFEATISEKISRTFLATIEPGD